MNPRDVTKPNDREPDETVVTQRSKYLLQPHQPCFTKKYRIYQKFLQPVRIQSKSLSLHP